MRKFPVYFTFVIHLQWRVLIMIADMLVYLLQRRLRLSPTQLSPRAGLAPALAYQF
jgi:hypothetical protein